MGSVSRLSDSKVQPLYHSSVCLHPDQAPCVCIQSEVLYPTAGTPVQVLRFRKTVLFIFPFHLQSSLVRWVWLSLILYTKKLREMKDLLKGTVEKWVNQDSTRSYLIHPGWHIPEFLSQLPFDNHKYHMSFNIYEIQHKYSILWVKSKLGDRTLFCLQISALTLKEVLMSHTHPIALSQPRENRCLEAMPPALTVADIGSFKVLVELSGSFPCTKQKCKLM